MEGKGVDIIALIACSIHTLASKSGIPYDQALIDIVFSLQAVGEEATFQ